MGRFHPEAAAAFSSPFPLAPYTFLSPTRYSYGAAGYAARDYAAAGSPEPAGNPAENSWKCILP